MKKKLFGLMLLLIMVAVCPFFVNAEEESALDKLVSCVSKDNTCILTENIELTSTLVIENDVVLDLAGYQITSDAATAIKVLAGNVTIKDSSSNSTGKIEVSGEAFRMGVKGVTTDSKDSMKLTIESGVDVVSTNDSCVVIYAGTLKTAGNLVTKGGYFAAVTGSGNPGNEGTVINITGGIVQHESNLAVYQPQVGTLTIDGGTITGKTGVEVRSGTLVVNGGTIIGTNESIEAFPNGNGSTIMGAGVSVSQHTTKNAINVTINGGTIKGFSALYQANPEKNSNDDIAKVKVTVKGGTFETINDGTQVLYSENNLIVVEEGSFGGEISEDFATEGSEVYEVITTEGEVKYVVAEETEVEEGYFGLGFTEEGFETVFGSQDEYEEVMGLIEEKLAQKYSAAIYYEMVYGGLLDGNLINDETLAKTKLDKAIEVKLDIPETLEKVKEGYTRKYVVIRVHFNEETKKYETDVLDVKEVKDGKVTFETDRFSTYVLAYEDVKDTSNPKTFDGISSIMFVVGLSLVSLLAVALYAKNKKVFN